MLQPRTNLLDWRRPLWQVFLSRAAVARSKIYFVGYRGKSIFFTDPQLLCQAGVLSGPRAFGDRHPGRATGPKFYIECAQLRIVEQVRAFGALHDNRSEPPSRSSLIPPARATPAPGPRSGPPGPRDR